MIILRQREFGMRQEIDKDKEKLYQDMKKKYPGLYRNRDFVSHYKTLSQDEQKYISNRDADEFTDYIWSQVNKRRNLDLTNKRENAKLKSKNYSDPIYYQDGVMLRYNGNKIDDVREVLSTEDIKILDKIMKSYKEDYFNREKDFLSRRGLNKQHVLKNLKIFGIDIWSTKKGFVYTIDCELKRIPGIITGEYDNLGNNYSEWSLND